MGIRIKLDANAIKNLGSQFENAAIKTMEVLKGDVVSSQTMPFNSGNMQNGGIYTDKSGNPGTSVKGNEVVNLSNGDNIHVVLLNDAPQARRLYFHPEYNFQKGKNQNAGGEWLEPYISGNEKNFIGETFAKLLKQNLK